MDFYNKYTYWYKLDRGGIWVDLTAATWSGVPSHVIPDSRESWGLPPVAAAPGASEYSWGGDDWSSEDESVRDSRLMPPPPPTSAQPAGQRQTLAQRNSYGSTFQNVRLVFLPVHTQFRKQQE